MEIMPSRLSRYECELLGFQIEPDAIQMMLLWLTNSEDSIVGQEIKGFVLL